VALSVVDLYRDILPKTNCSDCGFSTCLAFAGMVVSEKYPLRNCPHLDPSIIDQVQKELDEQYAAGKWLKRDMTQDALEWAKKKSSSIKIEELPDRIGGKLIHHDGYLALELPYFTDSVLITKDHHVKKEGAELSRWEQVFILNHIAQGGSSLPTGTWKGFVEFPNTVSKIKSMVEHIEKPLIEKFRGKADKLLSAAKSIGGSDRTGKIDSADLAVLFNPFPRVPVMLLFWDEEKSDGFGAEVKLLFDETITEHLDIESIMFLSERLKQLLCEDHFT
jgi:hypothetical protein